MDRVRVKDATEDISKACIARTLVFDLANSNQCHHVTLLMSMLNLILSQAFDWTGGVFSTAVAAAWRVIHDS